MSQLTEDEIQTLKEIAQNIQSAGRVGRILQTALIWAAGVIGSWLVVWEFFLKNIGKA